MAKTASLSAKVATGTRSQTEATRPVDLPDWVGFENRFANRTQEAARTLLLVDECQTFDDAGSLLRALHTQNQFPFLLVCGGLSDTSERLAALGLSRLGNDALIELGELSIDEARESAQQTLGWILKNAADPPIRHTEAQIEQWADQLSNESLGWPQHLASYAPYETLLIDANHTQLVVVHGQEVVNPVDVLLHRFDVVVGEVPIVAH